MTAAAGYFLASKGHYNFRLLFWLLAGITFIIGSACVFNNFIDSDIDKRMERTKDRALVTGKISGLSANIYGSILGILGFLIMLLYTNLLTVSVGAVGIISYVLVYGYFKRRSVHGTLIGSISGATSLVAGYCAVSGRFDLTALALFIIMAVWQMPHFYAIGVYRRQDYADASLPILPVVKGIPVTKRHILYYISLYIFSISLLTLLGATGYVYLGIMLLTGFFWLRLAVRGINMKDDVKYGHQIFGYSLVALIAFSIMISINHYLP